VVFETVAVTSDAEEEQVELDEPEVLLPAADTQDAQVA
jgi:hypothetical protein